MKGDAMADKEMPQIEPTTSPSAAMTVVTCEVTDVPLIVSAYDWGTLGHVVDVGGGDGTLVIALLNEYATLRGTVVELPEPAEVARKLLAAAGLADRGQAVAGDFFGTLPTGAEGYLLCSVLQQWSDEEARAILRNCATAAGEDGAVFVIEKLAEARALASAELASADRLRTRDVGQLTVLAENAGLAVSAVHTAEEIAILELSTP
jgi:O-methyltransferase